jgi:hypothetical protein
LNKNMLAMRLKPGFKPGEKDNTPPPPPPCNIIYFLGTFV